MTGADMRDRLVNIEDAWRRYEAPEESNRVIYRYLDRWMCLYARLEWGGMLEEDRYGEMRCLYT